LRDLAASRAVEARSPLGDAWTVSYNVAYLCQRLFQFCKASMENVGCLQRAHGSFRYLHVDTRQLSGSKIQSTENASRSARVDAILLVSSEEAHIGGVVHHLIDAEHCTWDTRSPAGSVRLFSSTPAVALPVVTTKPWINDPPGRRHDVQEYSLHRRHLVRHA
jgi:hypothetical protein